MMYQLINSTCHVIDGCNYYNKLYIWYKLRVFKENFTFVFYFLSKLFNVCMNQLKLYTSYIKKTKQEKLPLTMLKYKYTSLLTIALFLK